MRIAQGIAKLDIMFALLRLRVSADVVFNMIGFLKEYT